MDVVLVEEHKGLIDEQSPLLERERSRSLQELV